MLEMVRFFLLFIKLETRNLTGASGLAVKKKETGFQLRQFLVLMYDSHFQLTEINIQKYILTLFYSSYLCISLIKWLDKSHAFTQKPNISVWQRKVLLILIHYSSCVCAPFLQQEGFLPCGESGREIWSLLKSSYWLSTCG